MALRLEAYGCVIATTALKPDDVAVIYQNSEAAEKFAREKNNFLEDVETGARFEAINELET